MFWGLNPFSGGQMARSKYEYLYTHVIKNVQRYSCTSIYNSTHTYMNVCT